jgi:hypothetical protein
VTHSEEIFFNSLSIIIAVYLVSLAASYRRMLDFEEFRFTRPGPKRPIASYYVGLANVLYFVFRTRRSDPVTLLVINVCRCALVLSMMLFIAGHWVIKH